MLILIPKKIEPNDFFFAGNYLLTHQQSEIISRKQLEQIYNVQMAWEQKLDCYIEPYREEAILIFLDEYRRLFGTYTLDRGDMFSVDVIPEKILHVIEEGRRTYRMNIKYFAIVHNHPDGLALPSEADILNCEYIQKYILKSNYNIELLEDFIAGRQVDLRFDDTLFKKKNTQIFNPMTIESYISIKKMWFKKTLNGSLLPQKEGSTFFQKMDLFQELVLFNYNL